MFSAAVSHHIGSKWQSHKRREGGGTGVVSEVVGEAAHLGPMTRRRITWDSDSDLETDPRPIVTGRKWTVVTTCHQICWTPWNETTMEIPRRRE